jgi:hypothetical protein
LASTGRKSFLPPKIICRRNSFTERKGHFHGKKKERVSAGLRLPLNISQSSQRTFRSRAKLPSSSLAPRGRQICRVRALLRCRVQLELGPQPRERWLRAKASWLSCAGCEMTMARRFSFCLDLYPCFCGSFFVSARQQRAGLRAETWPTKECRKATTSCFVMSPMGSSAR